MSNRKTLRVHTEPAPLSPLSRAEIHAADLPPKRETIWRARIAADAGDGYKRREAHSQWGVLKLSRQLTRYGVDGFGLAARSFLATLCAHADDRTGVVNESMDELAAAAGIHRATAYKLLPMLIAAGFLTYAPGRIAGGRGHKSRFRLDRKILAAAANMARAGAEVRAAARRQVTTVTAAELGDVHPTKPQRLMTKLFTLANRAQDARYKPSHEATQLTPSGSVLPTTDPIETPDDLDTGPPLTSEQVAERAAAAKRAIRRR